MCKYAQSQTPPVRAAPPRSAGTNVLSVSIVMTPPDAASASAGTSKVHSRRLSDGRCREFPLPGARANTRRLVEVAQRRFDRQRDPQCCAAARRCAAWHGRWSIARRPAPCCIRLPASPRRTPTSSPVRLAGRIARSPSGSPDDVDCTDDACDHATEHQRVGPPGCRTPSGRSQATHPIPERARRRSTIVKCAAGSFGPARLRPPISMRAAPARRRTMRGDRREMRTAAHQSRHAGGFRRQRPAFFDEPPGAGMRYQRTADGRMPPNAGRATSGQRNSVES